MLSCWSIEEESVKRVTLDTDEYGGTHDETADEIDVSMRKLDKVTHQCILAGQHDNTSGGGTGKSHEGFIIYKLH